MKKIIATKLLKISDSTHDVILKVDKQLHAEVEEMAGNAFDDQRMGSNLYYSLIADLKEIFAHYGCRIDIALYNQDDAEAIAEGVGV